MAAPDPGSEGTQASREERLAIVEEHVEQENRHDLDGIMATFGDDPWYRDEGQGEHHDGHDGVRAHYEELVRALPDLHIDVQERHVTADHVILEVVLSGTHTGEWNGLPGTGRPVEFPVCSVFAFDDQNKLAGERIYYDRATLLRLLGIFREPDRGLGQLLTVLTHPLTIARAVARNIRAE